jgi:O-antigen/teichoic acid export membrane protein
VTARLIAPADFGRATIAIVVGTLAVALVQQGIGTPLVQRKENLLPGDLGAALVLSFVLGIGFTMVTIALAPSVVGALIDPRTAEMVQISAPAFAFASLGAVPTALLERKLAFSILAANAAAASVAGAITSVVCAVAGLEGRSLVYGLLATTFVLGAAPWLTAPRFGIAVSRTAFARLLSFGIPAAGSSVLWIAVMKVDYAILGAKLGPAVLGQYVRAFQLGSEYQGKLTNVMTTMALPLYSRAESPDELRELRTRITRLHATAILPLLFIVAATAPALVPLMFGPGWEAAIDPARILTVVGIAATLGAGSAALINAFGRPRVLLAYTAFELICVTGVIWLAADEGLIVASAALAGTRVVLLLILFRVVIQPVAGIPAWSTLRYEVGPALVAGLPMLIVAGAITEALVGLVPNLVTVALASVVGLTTYGLVLRYASSTAWRDLRLLVNRLRP